MSEPSDANVQGTTLYGTHWGRFVLGATFFVGTVLATLGWFIELKGWDQISIKLQHLTVLAIIGHAMQVIAAFGMLITPDREGDEKSAEDASVHRSWHDELRRDN